MDGSILLVPRELPEILRGPQTVRSIDGRDLPIIQLNNAATTPPLAATLDAVNRFLAQYGALHRGAGPRARATCQAVDAAIATIRSFVGAGDGHAVVFTENTSAAVNLLARMLRLGADDVVLTSEIEHTSNYLPWQFSGAGRLVEVQAFADGSIDYDDLEAKARALAPRVRVIAISGASNQTGYIPDIPRLSSIAREIGAMLFVDAAQLAPHRPIEMAAAGIDALALSAHKVYAPFGLGVLVVPEDLLDTAPVDPGGGSIDMITKDRIIWAPPRERHQTGTWNATGIVALAASCAALQTAGWEAIMRHERNLLLRLVDRLENIPSVHLHVPASCYRTENRTASVPFTVRGLHHAQVAAILEYEYGIEVRAGTICNHRLVRRWFGSTDDQQADIETRIAGGDRLASYGIVRASLGLHNSESDIDALAHALGEISDRGPRLTYRPVGPDETYEPILSSERLAATGAALQ